MIIDGHLHFGGPYGDINSLLKSMDEAGIDKVMAVPYMYKDGLDINTSFFPLWLVESKLAVAVVNSFMQNRWFRKRFTERPDNVRVLKLTQQFPDRFMGLYWLNPLFAGDIDEMEAMLTQGHFVGVKLHQVIHPFEITDRKVQRIFAEADKHRAPVFLHLANRQACRQIVSVAEKHPGAKFIIAHLIHHKDTVQDAARLENLFYDISPLCLPKTDKIYDVIKTAGFNKLIFGTDAPCPGGQKLAVQKVLDLHLTPEEKTAILGGNLLNILQSRFTMEEGGTIIQQRPASVPANPAVRGSRYPGN